VSGPRTLAWAAVVLALAGCDGGAARACPAIGWSNQLTVRLAEDWPPGGGRSVRVEGSSACAWEVRRDGFPEERTGSPRRSTARPRGSTSG
jgi:hypothetical protein